MKKTYSDVIERMKKMSKVTTDVELAELLGVKKSSISAYKDRGIPKDKLALFSQKYQVSLTWLEEGKGEAPDFAKLEENPTAYEDEKPMLRLEVLDVYASAGNGSFLTGDLTSYTHAVEFENAYFAQVFQRASAKGLSIINVDGDSMEPTIGNGDLLFVDTTKSAYQGDGVYVFSYGENLYVKRLQFAGDVLLVISDNPLYKEWKITSENEHKFKIHGKVEFMQGHIRRV